MNDDVDAAELELAKGNSAYHKLGGGVVTFLRATLGFETEVMREGSRILVCIIEDSADFCSIGETGRGRDCRFK